MTKEKPYTGLRSRLEKTQAEAFDRRHQWLGKHRIVEDEIPPLPGEECAHCDN
jgi:hypothetical protein